MAGNQTRVETAANLSAAVFEPSLDAPRPRVRGKFLFVGEEKFYLRGVTYGTFGPDATSAEYDPAQTERDFAQMAAEGLNAVRTYTVPPLWLLDAAQRHGLRVMAGLPWEQHLAFLDEPERARGIVEKVRAGVRVCARHPAVLCYAIGNEIPASVVRWHGARRVENFLRRLYRAAKAEDPKGLVTYVNYPSTEYLNLAFADFLCFNVYLEAEEQFTAYLARLQNIAGERPLVLAEIGLDSQRNGAQVQAMTLAWQLRAAFGAGCAGAFVFAWTDEWHRGGHDIADWDFGLTTRQRAAKPALAAVSQAFAAVPFAAREWPRVSVVVCTYNGARTIRDCLDGLRGLAYPNFEVIVVNDGSTDATPDIVRAYPEFCLINTANRGLSAARNTGYEAATGELVAYTDDDAHPDPHWLTYLAATFMETTHAGVGGPNIAPRGDGPIAECVANAPGGPVHVLLSDTAAEHIPGCNMAFRRRVLLKLGGFDAQFRAAGDDVDFCWRVLESGGTLGFSPAAMVWHHRRNSARMYWRQQRGYGKAEALLEAKWPEKYNAAGHLTWGGRLYGKGLLEAWRLRRGRIYQGTWGAALFQSVYQPAAGLWRSLPLMPEWWLLIGALAALAALGLRWKPLLLALPLLGLAVGAAVAQAVAGGVRAKFQIVPASRAEDLKLRALTALLHFIQPLARLRGRIEHGLSLWRNRSAAGLVWPRPFKAALWSENWREPAEWLRSLDKNLRAGGTVTQHGGDFDAWDLEARGGLLGRVRLLAVAEEHGAGRQLVRVRAWLKVTTLAVGLASVFGLLGLLALLDKTPAIATALLTITFLLVLRVVYETSLGIAAARAAVNELAQESGVTALGKTLGASRVLIPKVLPELALAGEGDEEQ